MSMVMEGGIEDIEHKWPTTFTGTSFGISRKEFDELKSQVEFIVRLLKKAKLYDEETQQPDCENEEKMALLRKVAEAVGIDLDKELRE